MKSKDSLKRFPKTPAEWERALRLAPGSAKSPDPQDEADIEARSVIVMSGGPAAVRSALAAKRKPGQRGPQKAPTKERVSLRLSREVLAHFRAGGAGWQSRIDETLKELLSRKRA